MTASAPARRWWKRLLIALLAAAVSLSLFAGWFGLGPDDLLRHAQRQRDAFQSLYQEHPVATLAGYFLLFVAFTAPSLPGALFLTILAGMLFPFWVALPLVSFAAALGATLAFLSARYLLRNRVLRLYGDHIPAIHRELDRAGGYYLLSMRLNPLVPYVLINLLFGVTALPVWKFWLVTQIGMLPVTSMYLLAGGQLGTIRSVLEIFTPQVLGLFMGLSLVPLVTRALALRLHRTAASGAQKS